MKRKLSTLALLLPMAMWAMACGPGIIGPTTNPPPTGTTPPPVVTPNPDPPDPPITRREPPPTPTTNPNAPKPFQDKWTKTNQTKPSTGVIGATFGRSARRLSVEQLRNSIPLLFPGLDWEYKSGSTYRSYFDRYAQTLGEADYLQITETTRESSSLFFKFMDDMASWVCRLAVAADLKEASESKRHIIRYDKDVNATLRFLRLKFHGIWVPKTSTESIAQLRKLHDNIMSKTKDNKTETWKGVCIAVLTAPEFFAY